MRVNRRKRVVKREPRRIAARDRNDRVSRKGAKGKIYMYGKHALMEALRNAPHIVRKVFLETSARGAGKQSGDTELRILLSKNNIPIHVLTPSAGKNLVGKDAVHQGVIALIDPNSLLVPFDAFLTSLHIPVPPSTAIAVLGEVQDPHNVGAIIRSAAAFGFAGVLIPEHNQAQVTGAVIKASAGMAFRIPLVAIGNVNNALAALKERGFWTYALTMHGSSVLGTEIFDSPTAFVIGNEGAGVREKTLESCDVALSIPMHARTESLNAAASAAIAFYEWSRKHPESLGSRKKQ